MRMGGLPKASAAARTVHYLLGDEGRSMGKMQRDKGQRLESANSSAAVGPSGTHSGETSISCAHVSGGPMGIEACLDGLSRLARRRVSATWGAGNGLKPNARGTNRSGSCLSSSARQKMGGADIIGAGPRGGNQRVIAPVRFELWDDFRGDQGRLH